MEVSTTHAIREKLRQVFGYDQFRASQEAIIQNVLAKKDTFVIMPTGGGKSLCYQIPALMQPGMAIVISPLIALMKNQVDQLRSRGIHSAFLNSTLSKKAINEIQADVFSGKIKMLYVAPESLGKPEHLAFLKQAEISFVAVDEAHCISDWGHDFRPEYRKIKTIVDEELGQLPIIALTATATPRVRKDILKNLNIEDAACFQSSFDRTNLYYEVQPKGDAEKQLITFIKKQPDASGIIYCQSRKKVEELATLLKLNDIEAAPYHAGLDARLREQTQDKFLNNKAKIIVATIAFGMGIDKPNVRFVVHYDIPRSLEGYYQETGRAGRDGAPASCLLFHSEEDHERLDRFNKNKPDAERDKARTLLQEMVGYALSGVCRRRVMLHYFGEIRKEACGDCDNCKQPTEAYLGEDLVKLVMDAVQQTKERFTEDHIIRVIMGITDSYVKSYQHQELSVFGKGDEHSATFWKSIIKQAELADLLYKDITQDSTLKISEAGYQFISKSYPITLYKDRDYTSTALQASSSSSSALQTEHSQQLKEQLELLRTEVAKKKKLPEYLIIQDSSLEEMATACPTTLEDLGRIAGISMRKATRIGAPFVELIQKHVQKNGITPVSDILIKSAGSKSSNKVYIIQQVDRKCDLEEIASAKALTMDSLLKEMEQICYAGTKLDISYYIDVILDKDQQDELHDYFMQAKTDNISEAESALDGEFDNTEIRLMRIKLLSEYAN